MTVHNAMSALPVDNHSGHVKKTREQVICDILMDKLIYFD